MDNVQATVLNYCVRTARSGDGKIDVFELFYETGITFDQLNKALFELERQKEIERTDLKFYKFIGDVNRKKYNAVDDSVEDAEQQQHYTDQSARTDEYNIKALQFCIEQGEASVSMIQRRFPVGYVRACKIIDWMEEMNFITSVQGAKPRKIVITQDEFDMLYGCKKLSMSDNSQASKRQTQSILDRILRRRWVESYPYEEEIDDDVTIEDFDDDLDQDLEDYVESVLMNQEKKESLDSVDWGFHYEENVAEPNQATADGYLRSLCSAFSLIQSKEGTFIKANFNYKTGDCVRFRFVIRDGGGLTLTDAGFTKNIIIKQSVVGSMRADRIIQKAITDTSVEYKQNELQLATVESRAVIDFMYLYSIINGLL